MIKFFRKIRQNLIMENKTSKYLKYAIGEIVLVVIGILIALSINNWNENRKEKTLETKVLIELLKSLENNCNVMVQDSITRLEWDKSSDIIIFSLQNNVSYSDSLNIHFQNARKPGANLSLSSAGYESLKNIGYNIITSDTLRNNIVELFELTQKHLFEEMEYFESFQPDRQVLVDRLFSYDEGKFDPKMPFDIPLIPHDYESLKDDALYMSMIKSVKVQRNIIAVFLNRNLNESKKAIHLIKTELNKSK
jgi:hypothetical protein